MAYLNPNSNQIRIRDGKVSPIVVPQEQLEQLTQALQSNKYTPSGKDKMIRKVTGGLCCGCRGVPELQVIYSLEGASMIERYCDSCIKKVFAREHTNRFYNIKSIE